MPWSVRYARGLLWLQGGIWACGALMYAAWTVAAGITALTGDALVFRAGGVLFLPVAAITGGFATVKFFLARSLAGRRERVRKTVIGVEIGMACLGALVIAGTDFSGGLPAGIVALAGFAGGGLSLAAALAMLRRPARQFFAEPGPASRSPSDGDSSASFSAPVGTTRRYLTLRTA